MLSHFFNQSHTLDTFQERKNTDAGKFKKKVIKVFIQTEFDDSSGTGQFP